MPITAFYAALLAALFLYLSVRVIGWRRDRRVEFGHGEDFELLRRMRVHANFAEYVPFAIVLMGLAESMEPPDLLRARRRGAARRGPLDPRLRRFAITAHHAISRLRHVADVRLDNARGARCA